MAYIFVNPKCKGTLGQNRTKCKGTGGFWILDLEFLILNLWNSARRCLAAEYILIGVCSQPRYYATPQARWVTIYELRFTNFVGIGSPLASGVGYQYYYHAGAWWNQRRWRWLNHLAEQGGEWGVSCGACNYRAHACGRQTVGPGVSPG